MAPKYGRNSGSLTDSCLIHSIFTGNNDLDRTGTVMKRKSKAASDQFNVWVLRGWRSIVQRGCVLIDALKYFSYAKPDPNAQWNCSWHVSRRSKMADQVIISGEEEVSGEEEGRYDTLEQRLEWCLSYLPPSATRTPLLPPREEGLSSSKKLSCTNMAW